MNNSTNTPIYSPWPRTGQKNLERVLSDFDAVMRALALSEHTFTDAPTVAATLVLAAHVDAVEDALIEGLPTAGEGI